MRDAARVASDAIAAWLTHYTSDEPAQALLPYLAVAIEADRDALLDDVDRELEAEQRELTGQARYYLERAREVVRRVRGQLDA
jgi:hypothetical protein